MKIKNDKPGALNIMLILAILTASAGIHAAPVAVIDTSGVLTGITGVEVAGYGTWDVTFNDLWQGDLYAQDFAQKATTSIHDIFSPGGFLSGSVYDTRPYYNIEGCRDSNHCDTFTVYDDSHVNDSISYVRGYFWRNFSGNYPAAESPETATIYSQGIQSPLSLSNVIHASWDNSQYVSSVPVPAAAWLFGSGLIGLISVARRNS